MTRPEIPRSLRSCEKINSQLEDTKTSEIHEEMRQKNKIKNKTTARPADLPTQVPAGNVSVLDLRSLCFFTWCL
jgi:hypothetical protein